MAYCMADCMGRFFQATGPSLTCWYQPNALLEPQTSDFDVSTRVKQRSITASIAQSVSDANSATQPVYTTVQCVVRRSTALLVCLFYQFTLDITEQISRGLLISLHCTPFQHLVTDYLAAETCRHVELSRTASCSKISKPEALPGVPMVHTSKQSSDPTPLHATKSTVRWKEIYAVLIAPLRQLPTSACRVICRSAGISCWTDCEGHLCACNVPK